VHGRCDDAGVLCGKTWSSRTPCSFRVDHVPNLPLLVVENNVLTASVSFSRPGTAASGYRLVFTPMLAERGTGSNFSRIIAAVGFFHIAVLPAACTKRFGTVTAEVL